MNKLISKLQTDYPKLNFAVSKQFSWSPHTQTITTPPLRSLPEQASWSLLHEAGHALLDHKTYTNDLELVELENAAWDKAKQLARTYQVTISEEYVQDCMDTYRDWLHQRSTCPSCNNRSLQEDKNLYRCYNCNQTWTVTTSRFCRSYRRKSNQSKTSPPQSEMMFAEKVT